MNRMVIDIILLNYLLIEMNISLDDDIITDDNDTEDIISESQSHCYTSDNIINTHQLSTGMYMS